MEEQSKVYIESCKGNLKKLKTTLSDHKDRLKKSEVYETFKKLLTKYKKLSKSSFVDSKTLKKSKKLDIKINALRDQVKLKLKVKIGGAQNKEEKKSAKDTTNNKKQVQFKENMVEIREINSNKRTWNDSRKG